MHRLGFSGPSAVLLLALTACGGGGGGATGPDEAACESTFPTTGADPGYRVVLDPAPEDGGRVAFPSPDQGWTLEYVFDVPPLPCTPTWNHTDQVFYVWGDVDFDEYGARGSHPLSDYRFNQIVPQATVGRALDGNDAQYRPAWENLDRWIIQAQYFWMGDDGTPYALAGTKVPVSPGHRVTTRIVYDPDAGTVAASIGTVDAMSSILIPRPFPNESPAPFPSWRAFFEAAQDASGEVVGRPVLNVETHGVDGPTLCSVLPFRVRSMSLPDGPVSGSVLAIGKAGNFTCPGQDLAELSF